MTNQPVVLVRQIKAPIERVFEAWTNPEFLVQWFVPSDSMSIELVAFDASPGGSYRIVMQDEDRYCCFGTFRRVDPPTLLEFTWNWEESSVEKGESIVTVQLRAVGSETELTLSHASLANAESEKRHTHGWTAILDRLQQLYND